VTSSLTDLFDPLRHRRRQLFVVAVVAMTLASLSSLVGPRDALGYTLSRTDTGQHMRWNVGPQTPIRYTIDKAAQADLNLGEGRVREIVAIGFSTWKAVRCGVCHDPRGVACAPVSCAENELGLQFQDDGFTKQQPWGPICTNLAGEVTPVTLAGCPTSGGPWKKVPNGNQVMWLAAPGEWVFSQFTTALTLVAANEVTGAISDADILVNAEHKTFCIDGCKSNEYDLHSTITHEIGHLLGLDHTSVEEATMYAVGLPAELFMRDLHDDDIAGICQSYRMAFDSKGCPKTEEPGFFDCSSGPTRPAQSSVLWLLLVAIAVVVGGRFTSAANARLYSARRVVRDPSR